MASETKQVGHPDLVGSGETTLHTHKLNTMTAPDGSVEFNQQQALQLVIEKRTDDPATPIDGQIWLRTDL